MTDKIPSSWIYTKLENIVDIFDYERNPINNAERAQRISNKDPKELFSYYGATGQIGFIDDYRSEGERILLGEDAAPFLDPNKDKAYLVHGKYWVNNHAHILGGACNLVNNKFVLHQLNILDYREYVSGTTRLKLTSASMKQIPLVLAPYNEQIRIADKIDELFSELNNGIAELETAQKKLELYRQSLLKSAVEGELSKEWRETQTEVSETGEQLLARILKERRERWEQEKLKEFAEKGKSPPKDWQKKYPEPVQADTANLPKLPEGWVWATLSQVGWLDRGKSQYRPRNAPHLYGGDYPFIQTSDIRYADTFLENYEKTYSEAGLAQSRLWPIGTMCITIAANIGHTAIMSFEGCFPDSLVGFLTTSNDVSVRYIEFFMRTIQQKLEDEAPATAQKNINLDILSKVVLPLPPFKEQVYLVEVLDNQLEKLQLQHDTIKNSIESITKQKLNILKQAFNGKLVTQDTNDESALLLLERIQQQRETEALTKKATPKKRSNSKVKKEVSMSKTILDILKQQTNWISGQDLASAFGLSNNSEIEDIEKFYEELRTLSLNNEISIKPDCENSKEQDLIKLKDNTDAS
ncbi:restriction endonuclease subunit S [Acinetobacter baumannii]|uniref:restriction endonuclease subunit S n=1 Tax=Acinetobacter baumannii TaxID=470 RepID=UPI000ABC1F0B|nr:restriction endonuclease subunit S [Acinetobacter baumannii]ELA9169353.1 restriction endonuclease subunit S [Acinetobacter baumannii]KAB1100921.1 restriction endonuclease subunit S [Acinetobacter baumannii]MBZ0373021.1 restriction endonuclease subunit S [Acinetobacter baumannii]MCA4182357.1 restriction endonuclease subunit S [Acinetobacter baumannii]MCL8263637.1 restriction endonuclease subunit S [Acinetobacter baumannii]